MYFGGSSSKLSVNFKLERVLVFNNGKVKKVQLLVLLCFRCKLYAFGNTVPVVIQKFDFS